ncbi:MAG: family 78 glycoside hydrolase catalytic domain [Bryobacterales bacterium]|nr:family 78 glycoside hydrolase catalytic domain [Bryobacterales bacterium]
MRIVALLLLAAPLSAQPQAVQVHALRTEYLANPTAVEDARPRFSWKLQSAARGQKQTAYRILAASSPEALAAGKGDLWDTGRVPSPQSTQVEYAGLPLVSRRVVHWKVLVWDKDNRPTAFSAPARFAMGLLTPADWSAEWISHPDSTPLPTDRKSLHLPPARYYRQQFTAIAKTVRRATLYATALGIYDAYINGRRVSEQMFSPGWSDYKRRAYYNAHDVTALLHPGTNALGFIVADGWYSGYVGYGLLVGYGPHKTGRNFYGRTPALRAQLEIEYTDGSSTVVPTAPNWKQATGALQEADILMGETYDARLEPPNWSKPGFDDAKWQPAVPAARNGSLKAPFFDTSGEREIDLGFIPPPRLQAYSGPPIRPIEDLRPKRLTEPAPGVFVYDLGQNFSGVARLRVQGPAGTRVQLRFAEMLHSDGRLMTENLRRARATDTYILRGDPAGETWTPRFTYHGFQFVEVTGYPGRPTLDSITGVVVHSDTPLTSTFTSSDPAVNQLFRNIVWTQRSNFVELPTDCPQRDERLGWTGDAQAYIRTASYNADVAAFFTKWLDDLEEAQRPNGAFTDYAPYPMQHGDGKAAYGTAWMDAGIICPFTIFQVYGDRRVIDRHWAAMERFMQFRRAQSPNWEGARIGNPWGDWLNINSETPLELIDAAYFAYTSSLMARMAESTGRTAAAAQYKEWFRQIQTAFLKRYSPTPARLTIDNQTAYALALFAGIFPEDQRRPAAARLAELIQANGGRMNTGFLGTRALLPVLTANGQHASAVGLFTSRQFPGWLYEVENGATTVWERWNSFTKDKGFFNPSMNSFSHYAFGAVAEWMFRDLAGIETDGPGFQRLIIKPGAAPGQSISASYDGPYGPIAVGWKQGTSDFTLDLTIPPNSTATLHMPAGAITESGRAIRATRVEDGRSIVPLESGSYHFRSVR